MNKSKTLVWWDDEIKNSYLLCLEPYKIKILKEVPTENDNETEITIYGSAENVDRFIEDIEDDSLEPFENISLSYDDDDEYYSEINRCVNEIIQIKNYEKSLTKYAE